MDGKNVMYPSRGWCSCLLMGFLTIDEMPLGACPFREPKAQSVLLSLFVPLALGVQRAYYVSGTCCIVCAEMDSVFRAFTA